MPRLRPGQTVRIRDTVMHAHTFKIGVVIKVLPNKRQISTLDRYVVALPGGIEVDVWDIQLEVVEAEPPSTIIGL